MTKDQFMTLAVFAIDKHFPKGTAKERGEAMVLIADLMRGLMDAGLITDAEADA